MRVPELSSKLPQTSTSIFSVMSTLAREHEAINLSQGFPNFDPPLALRELVFEHMQAGHNQYAPMPGLPQLREVLVKKHFLQSDLELNPQTEVTVTAGATQALYTAITTIVQTGDEVILLEPAYDSYRPSVELSGGKVVAYQLEAPSYSVDWEEFSKLITDKTKLIILNTPHNPTGTIWSRTDWEQLQKIVEGTNIFILSDEVYEQLVYDGEQHLGLLNFPDLFKRGMATFSFGKTFHSTGWKMGYCLGPVNLMKEFRKIHQFNVFSVNTPVQYALASYLDNPDHYEYLHSFYQQKRDYFLEAIKGSSLRPLSCAGTYFQLFDYSDIQSNMSDVDFAHWLTKKIGVATIPVSAFHSIPQKNNIIRVCFAKTEELLEQAAQRLVKL